MSGDYLAVQALGFATGSVLFAMLVALAWRQGPQPNEAFQAQQRLWARTAALTASVAAGLGLLWNLGSLGQFTALLFGLPLGSVAYRVSAAVAWSAIAMSPTAILVLLRPAGWVRVWQARGSRWFLWLSVAIAAFLTLGFVGAAFSGTLKITLPIPGFDRPVSVAFNTLMRLSAYNLALHVAVGAFIARGAIALTPAARRYSLTMLLWAFGLGLLLMVSMNVGLPARTHAIVETVTQQSTIPMAILWLVYLGRFRLADVFVKRSLVIVASVAVALFYLLVIVQPLVRALQNLTNRSGYAESVGWLAATILWGSLLLLFPRLRRAIHRAVDRWLFRRPDYRALAERFSRDTDTIKDEQELFELAGRVICDAVQAGSVQVVVEAECGTGGPSDESSGPIHIPIPVIGIGGFVLWIHPADRGRKLLSEEMTFLSLMADRIGRRLESLRFERELRDRELAEARLRHLLTEAELKALRAQLDPHFLFNTLNTILDLIGSEPEKAEVMIERLSELFRHVMVRTERDMTSVGEEIEFLQKYLEIERARFGSRLVVDLEIDPAVTAELIPSLILQPLVENALKHGLAPKLGTGTIRISALDLGDTIQLVVEDDGVGWPGDYVVSPIGRQVGAGEQVGLRNVRERLESVYGDRSSLNISGGPGLSTTVSISISKKSCSGS